MSYLDLARRIAAQLERSDPPACEGVASTLTTSPIIETREYPGAVLLCSPRFGEVWLLLDPCLLAELAAEEAGRPNPRPVLRVEDVACLRGKPEVAIRAALEVARVFPGARMR